MTKTIIAFLLKERYLKNLFKNRKLKVLKNKKGFSLLEVLIAVAIIGIIGTIAVPQFNKQRENAAQVAVDTSASNIVKAFQVCTALKAFTSCDKLSKIEISCPSGSVCDSGGTGGQFCAHIKRGTSANGNDFNVCISVNVGGQIERTYGGALLSQKSYCHQSYKDASNLVTCTNTNPITASPLRTCTTNSLSTDCANSTATNPDSSKCAANVKSCTAVTHQGTCTPSTGRCS